MATLDVPEKIIAMPEAGDQSRPKPVKVLLVGGPMDHQLVDCPVEATHISYWVYRIPSTRIPRKEEYDTDATMKIYYQIHPIVGNSETWYIGRPVGMKFDEALNIIMEHYRVK